MPKSTNMVGTAHPAKTTKFTTRIDQERARDLKKTLNSFPKAGSDSPPPCVEYA